MGVRIVIPVSRKKRVISVEKPDEDHMSWQWGAFECTEVMDDVFSHPTRKSPSEALAESPDSGLTGDVAAVCCCPLSLLHLLTIAFFKLPSALMAKTVKRIKAKILSKRKRAAAYEDDDVSIAPSSFPPSRSRSYEAGDIQTWAPALGFGDQRLWKDYFDSPDAGVSSSGELRRTKS